MTSLPVKNHLQETSLALRRILKRKTEKNIKENQNVRNCTHEKSPTLQFAKICTRKKKSQKLVHRKIRTLKAYQISGVLEIFNLHLPKIKND